MKVYILEQIHEVPISLAESRFEVIKWDDPRITDWSDADAVIARIKPITREMMQKAPKLKIIAKYGVGVDNVDLDAAKELGIYVTITPNANNESVAELAVTLILACARKITKSMEMIRNGLETHAPKELTGIELKGKTAGLIGLGRIGYRVGCILKNGFGMELLGYDPYISDERFNELGVKKANDLEELLSNSDVISISIPLTPSTENLIGEKELNMMKKNAILVNTSRGKIVNEAALYEALRTGRINSAALDVFEIEPPDKDYPLLNLDNFIGTPHIGAATEEALIRVGKIVVDEVTRVLEGKEPLYSVIK